MHWLYPAVFGVYGGEKGKSIALAADATIRKKIERDGAHTSWSAAWAACLSARMGQSQLVGAQLQKILKRYTLPNSLWSLHPNLKAIDSFGTRGCNTCFRENVLGADPENNGG